MPITADYHLHTLHSGDCETKMEDVILAAIKKGLTHIAFTEHNDFDYPTAPGEPEDMFLLNVDSYLYELLGLRGKYQDQIRIQFGIEIGLQKECVRKNAILAKSHEFDFIIASSHVLNGIDPYYGKFYEGRDEVEANREFFSSIFENIKAMPNFDVCGHLDYILRYAPNKNANFHLEDYSDIFDQIFNYLIENEKGIECNTAGFRNGLGTTNPSLPLIKRYRELGGEIITIGSDAHTIDAVGTNLLEAEAILKEAGFKYYSVYENRLPEFKKLI